MGHGAFWILGLEFRYGFLVSERIELLQGPLVVSLG